MREILDDNMQDLLIWLAGHESDIADGVDDFGDLQGVFYDLYGRNAGEPDEVVATW